ncbi:unnamed protein product [Pleuronectes platessa]|uniref:Uncharacterized protein n=1 Tax=Pleuronectes platessa TaxID=8262 RepID=A0A9N7TVJ0_PLEPL|nr:unnamed protein product [Pleuronectes platessa]
MKPYTLEEFSYDYFRPPPKHTLSRVMVTKNSWEGQTVELHQGAAQTAAAEEGGEPRGAESGRLLVLHRYPSNSQRDTLHGSS